MKLLAFDLDGTLTQHKTPIEEKNRSILKLLAKKYKLVIVGAGGCERIDAQLRGMHIDIVGNYGMQRSSYDEKGQLVLLENQFATVNPEIITQAAQRLREQLNLYPYKGETVEIHPSGLVTFPLLGTKAKQEDKLLYDPDRTKRRAMLAQVTAAFGGYTVVIGGSSSFDVVPRPYNKYYGLSRYASSLGIDLNEIMYFGDDFEKGGNDEAIYNSRISVTAVSDYRRLDICLFKAGLIQEGELS